ncbi:MULTISPECIES: hypothetical protein [Bacteroides]|uniref:hypothetical protein n=1 Tax=Bacteroides TaxID=816 RepID=UPI00259C6F82|nr:MULTISPECIES: hypothetical protein [Bacteroides]
MKLLLSNNIKVYLRLCFMFTFIISAISLKGENPPVVQIIPVSPTAASLGTFGNIPIGYYTGTAEISVPLYEIELDGKKFPINIAYHSSGIKVAQEAGCVGLGWALQGYGCITKEVRGWDDFESYPFGYYFNESLPIPDEENNYDTYKGSAHECKAYASGTKDGEPDMFHFSFGDYSGTMFFQRIGINNNTKTRAYPLLTKIKDNLYVEYNISDKTWKIIDGDGYAYYFGTYETTEYFQYSSNTNTELSKIGRNLILDSPRFPQPETVTAWYLDSIVSPRKNKIKFEYGEDYIYTLNQRQETIYHLLEASPYVFTSYLAHDIENYVYSCSKINQKILKKIETELLTAEIITDDRMDIESAKFSAIPKKVAGIQIKDKLNTLLKDIILEYKYTGVLSDYKSCRLFLKKIIDRVDNERHMYEFDYDRASSLPDKYSNAIDSWGYYNGKSASGTKWGTASQQSSSPYVNNITYVPEFRLKQNNPFSSDRAPFDLSFLGRSLVVSDKDITCGMLSSIKYPTGLITHFEYEPHALSNGSNVTVEPKMVELGTAYYRNFVWEDPEENEGLEDLSTYFSFELTEKTTVTLTWMAIVYESVDEDYTSFYRCAFLKDESGKIVKEISLEKDQFSKVFKFELSLPIGKYTVHIEDGNIITGHKFGLTVKAYKNILVPKEYEFVSKGGGVRVKRIYSTFDQKQVLDKKIIYSRQGKSTGILMSNPIFTYPFITRSVDFEGGYNPGSVPPHIVPITAFYVCGLSYPYTPFSFSAMGAPVGYDMVRVREAVVEGYTDYYYYNTQDEPLSSTEMYIPGFPTKGDLRNGLLKSKIVYNDDDWKVEKTDYQYACDKKEITKAFKAYTPLVFSTLATTDYEYMYMKFYDVPSERWALKEEVITTFADNEASSGMKSKVYIYSYSNDLPSFVEYINSDKTKKQIRYKYATDYTDPLSLKMRSCNLKNISIETLDLRNELVTKAEKTIYIDTLGMILPKTIYNLQPSSPLPLSNYSSYYKKKYSIDLYNKYGKILQLTGGDNISVAYLWSYKGVYPIAEIRNATYEEVISYLGNVNELENSLSPVMAPVENLRSLLKKSLVTTYNYKVPWGIQMIISPSGMKMTYNYDLFGRLMSIQDHDGKIVQSFIYNYRQ